MASEINIEEFDEGIEAFRTAIELGEADEEGTVYVDVSFAQLLLTYCQELRKRLVEDADRSREQPRAASMGSKDLTAAWRKSLVEDADNSREQPRVIQIATTLGGSVARLYSDGRVTIAYMHPDGRWTHEAIPEMPPEESHG